MTKIDTDQCERLIDEIAKLSRIISTSLALRDGLNIKAVDFDCATGFLWDASTLQLSPVSKINRIAPELLIGISQAFDGLVNNTERFAKGFACNNALLWGARGMGKSSLIKAVHDKVNSSLTKIGDFAPLKLIEIHREDISSLPDLMRQLRPINHKFIIFCDDLSFELSDTSYKSLKTVLEGGIEGKPANVVFYATSNRRHLISRDASQSADQKSLRPNETMEEMISLSDRFGLWLGFHHCDQDTYLQMVESYANYFALPFNTNELHRAALEWSIVRGSRSGRVAWQFIQDYAGAHGRALQE